MFELRDLDRRRMIFDRWTSAAGDMLDFREKWTEQDWKNLGRLTGAAMEEVLRVRPDLDTMPLAELFDTQSAKLRSRTELVNFVMRSMAVLEAAMATTGRKDAPIIEKSPNQALIGPAEAVRRFEEQTGLKMSLSTIERHKSEFGAVEGGSSYVFSYDAFVLWAIDWNQKKQKKRNKNPNRKVASKP
jgi:hypothetical protein